MQQKVFPLGSTYLIPQLHLSLFNFFSLSLVFLSLLLFLSFLLYLFLAFLSVTSSFDNLLKTGSKGNGNGTVDRAVAGNTKGGSMLSSKSSQLHFYFNFPTLNTGNN